MYGKHWCDYMIKHCDCSGIERLCISRMSFSSLDTDARATAIERRTEFAQLSIIMKNLAKKFNRLNFLEIEFETRYDLGALLLWKMLKPVIQNNNGTVEVTFLHHYDNYNIRRTLEKFKKLDAFIQQPYFTTHNIDTILCNSSYCSCIDDCGTTTILMIVFGLFVLVLICVCGC